MKKGIIIVAALGLLAVVSCKKDHSCSCTATSTSDLGTISVTVDTTLTDMNKKDADAACNNLDYSLTVGTSSVKQDCELK